MDESAPGADAVRWQVRRARGPFAAMVGCYALGVFNDNFFRQAVMLIALRAGRPQLQGWALAVFAAPYLLFAAPAGWLADRFPKRRVVVAAKGFEVAAMLCGAAGILTGSWPLMLAMVATMGLQSCLFNPSLNGSIPELYPAEYVPRANAVLKVCVTMAIFAGMVLAGVLLDSGGGLSLPAGEAAASPADAAWTFRPEHATVAATALGVAGAGLLVSLGVPRRRAADPARRFPWDGPLHSLRTLWEFRRDRLLATAVVAGAYLWFAGTAMVAVINRMGMEQYAVGERRTALMNFCQMVGVAVGGVIGSRMARGEGWTRVLGLPPFLMAGAMLLVAIGLPGLPRAAQVPALYPLLALVGVPGGVMLVPVEAFFQVRPAPERKGRTIAAATFAVFVGIVLAGPASNLLLGRLGMRPRDAFAVLAGTTLLLGLWLRRRLPPPARQGLLLGFFRCLARALLRLRYRVRVVGVEEIAVRGTRGILFLANHPALIDPVILLTVLHARFAPRPLADQDQVDRFLIRRLARRLGAHEIPDPAKYGTESRARIEEALARCAEDLRRGDNVLVYPAGHILRSRFEAIGANTAVEAILRGAPDARIVLVRTRGLWGSAFSFGPGRPPKVAPVLRRGAWALLLNGLFFAPRRPVDIALSEPEDLPRRAGRAALNAYLEAFLNRDAPPNTYVPYFWWEGRRPRTVPEPQEGRLRGYPAAVPTATREIVLARLREASGVAALSDDMDLAADLGMDSLARADLGAWVEREFGFAQRDTEALRTVGDVLLAASGAVVARPAQEVGVPPRRWFRGSDGGGRVLLEDAPTICAAFLRRARAAPGQPIVADRTSGVRTYRDLLTALFALKERIARLPGERVGIMLPASVAADTLYLAALFAGRTPVMVNWTVGVRHVLHSLDRAGVERVLTSRALVARLESRGMDLAALRARFVFLEEVRAAITRRERLRAAFRARFALRGLEEAPVPDTAVVLFTSGSESLPKAVPLTHANILADLRDVLRFAVVRSDDRLVGLLPPFHSFGLTTTVVLPLVTGLRVVHHPDPTDAGALAQIVEAYRATLLFGTPAFLEGIVRAARPGQLASLRIAVTGAEKCPERVYDLLAQRCPHVLVLEGYGVSECSPIISLNEEERPRRGTIGRALPSLEYAVVDAQTGRRIAPGEGRPGVLLVRGPTVFDGYLNAEGEPPFVAFEGKRWYRTGDLVIEDADGVLTFAGRLKRFVKVGGEMISLPAIESALGAHFPPGEDGRPRLAVEAGPDEAHPEIVLFTTVPLDREEANRLLRAAGLSPLHHVRRVVSVAEIPLLGTGKTDYRALRALLAAEGK